jgi:hypothetical protein
MQKTCTVALKEWAVVQRALLEGKQTILLRKGGLIEETGEFNLHAREFLILPTYIHSDERRNDIQPQYLNWLDDENSRRTSDGLIRFKSICTCHEIIKIKSADSLAKLSPEHIWSESYINMRLNWEPYKPLFALVVRAYRLSDPVVIAAKTSYYGCKSWVDLEESILVKDPIPALDDQEFQQKHQIFCELINNL